MTMKTTKELIRIDECESFGSVAELSLEDLIESYGCSPNQSHAILNEFEGMDNAVVLHHDLTGKWLVNVVDDVEDENSPAETYDVSEAGEIDPIDVDRNWG